MIMYDHGAVLYVGKVYKAPNSNAMQIIKNGKECKRKQHDPKETVVQKQSS
jgi:hypothetical protein